MISVIIPCYNHGRYLQQAIDSVRMQQYPSVEIIVINDGSTDDTELVARRNNVLYYFQANSGLASARNKGVEHATGDYLVFLDADDVFLENAFQYQVQQAALHPEAAFVSGGHVLTDENLSNNQVVTSPFEGDYYMHLLHGNYIGMHAAVLYRREVFEHFRFDTELKASEDYDLYFKVTKHFAVHNHQQLIAAYRIHGGNMSGNLYLMLHATLKVLHRQKKLLHTTVLKTAYRKGRYNWIYYYGQKMCDQMLEMPAMPAPLKWKFKQCFLQYRPAFLFKYLVRKYVKKAPAPAYKSF